MVSLYTRCSQATSNEVAELRRSHLLAPAAEEIAPPAPDSTGTVGDGFPETSFTPVARTAT